MPGYYSKSHSHSIQSIAHKTPSLSAESQRSGAVYFFLLQGSDDESTTVSEVEKDFFGIIRK